MLSLLWRVALSRVDLIDPYTFVYIWQLRPIHWISRKGAKAQRREV
jgi:hypothetical protein